MGRLYNDKEQSNGDMNYLYDFYNSLFKIGNELGITKTKLLIGGFLSGAGYTLYPLILGYLQSTEEINEELTPLGYPDMMLAYAYEAKDYISFYADEVIDRIGNVGVVGILTAATYVPQFCIAKYNSY